MGLRWMAIFLVGAACGTSGCHKRASGQSAEPLSSKKELVISHECPDELEAERTHEVYLQGKALYSGCQEECMKGTEHPEDRSRGLALLERAAEEGDRHAQSLYGRILFGDLMTTGQEQELEQEYVKAIYFLRLAIRRGDRSASAYLPELEKIRIMPSGFFPALTPPLSELDEDWVRQAILKADQANPCPVRQ